MVIEIKNNLEEKTKQAASQGYDETFVALVEMIYGKGFLSQGGPESVQKMIDGLNLDGKKILDIGSGLGGPALHVAKQTRANVTGLEPQKWMVEIANRNLNEMEEHLQGTVNFLHMTTTSNLHQFPDNSFDFIMSKEALLHIPHEAKKGFFTEIYRILKPSGQIVILDWMHSTPNYSTKTEEMMELDEVAYNLISPPEYLTLL